MKNQRLLNYLFKAEFVLLWIKDVGEWFAAKNNSSAKINFSNFNLIIDNILTDLRLNFGDSDLTKKCNHIVAHCKSKLEKTMIADIIAKT